MTKPNLKYQLFELSGERFELLCADLLNAEYNYDEFFINRASNDNGADILAFSGIKKIAIQVKHRYKIVSKELEKEIERCKSLLEFHHECVYITSASIARETLNRIQSDNIKILSQDDIIKLLDKHSDIGKRYFTILEKKKKRNRTSFYVSLLGVFLPLVAAFITIYSGIQSKDKPLKEIW